MNPLIIKGLVAAGGLGLGGIGIWQLTEYMAPKTLGQKLIKEGYGFHPFGDDNNLEGWKTLAQKYKSSTGDSPVKFESLDLSSTNQNDGENAKKLRDRCKTTAELELGAQNQDKNIKLLKDWCTATKPTEATKNTSPSGGNQ